MIVGENGILRLTNYFISNYVISMYIQCNRAFQRTCIEMDHQELQ